MHGDVVTTVIGIIGLLLAIPVMLRYAYEALNESILFGSLSPTPLQTTMWIPQSLWVAGLVLFSITALAILVHLLILQFRDSELAFRLYGPPTVQQEVDREMASAQAQRSAVADCEARHSHD